MEDKYDILNRQAYEGLEEQFRLAQQDLRQAQKDFREELDRRLPPAA